MITKREQLAIDRERAIDQLDREARDNGHDPHPWVEDETYTSHTACRNCGRTLVVRIYPDHVFKSGLPDKCRSVWVAGAAGVYRRAYEQVA